MNLNRTFSEKIKSSYLRLGAQVVKDWKSKFVHLVKTIRGLKRNKLSRRKIPKMTSITPNHSIVRMKTRSRLAKRESLATKASTIPLNDHLFFPEVTTPTKRSH